MMKAKIIFIVKELGIVHGLVYEKQSDGQQYDARKPDAQEWTQQVLLNKFFSKHVQEMEYQKEYDGHNQWHTKPTLSDDGAKRCANQEQHNTGKRQ